MRANSTNFAKTAYMEKFLSPSPVKHGLGLLVVTIFVSFSAYATDSNLTRTLKIAEPKFKQDPGIKIQIDSKKLTTNRKFQAVSVPDSIVVDRQLIQKDQLKMMRGGDGSGGGNTIAGKSVESYIVDPEQLIIYQKIVKPLIEKVRLKNKGLAALMEFGVQNTTWYFVPVTLKELSVDITGIPFETDQTAIQNFSTLEVWVDSNSFDGLENDIERAKILLHESLLTRLGKFTTDLPKLKKSIRRLGNFIFSDLADLPQAQFNQKLRDFGMTVTDDGTNLVCELDFPDRNDFRRPVLCTERSPGF